MQRKSVVLGMVSIVGILTLGLFLSLADFSQASDGGDLKLGKTHHYLYKVSVFRPEWNAKTKSFKTDKNVFFCERWRIKKIKSYTAVGLASPLYVAEEEIEVNMENGCSDYEGSGLLFAVYNYVTDDYTRIVVTRQSDKRVVWRNYDWDE